jgi:hypothetical protein
MGLPPGNTRGPPQSAQNPPGTVQAGPIMTTTPLSQQIPPTMGSPGMMQQGRPYGVPPGPPCGPPGGPPGTHPPGPYGPPGSQPPGPPATKMDPENMPNPVSFMGIPLYGIHGNSLIYPSGVCDHC